MAGGRLAPLSLSLLGIPVVGLAMLFEDLLYSQSLLYFGNVRRSGVPAERTQSDTPQVRYLADGYRTVFGISGESVSITEAENLSWERIPWQ